MTEVANLSESAFKAGEERQTDRQTAERQRDRDIKGGGQRGEIDREIEREE